MLTDLQWKYAKHQRDEDEHYRYGAYYSEYFDPMLNRSAAFEDMEQQQLEQDIYDEFENPACDYSYAFEVHQHHHELAEPTPAWLVSVNKITKLLEA